MLAIFRRSLATWPARLFFGVLVLSFGLWGVADVVRNIGHDSSVASVGGQPIEMPELQQAYQRDLAQAERMLGNTDPSPAMRRSIAIQSINQIITQKALAEAVRGLGVAVPENALADAITEVPQFRNAQGKYDPDLARQVLRNSGMNERVFGDSLRSDLGRQQVLSALTAGVVAPPEMARQVFEYQHEKRVADAVEVPLSAAAPAPAPTPLQVERWWANHPEKYSKPEYRRIEAIVLAPETLAKEITVTDDDLKAAWEQHKAEFNKPERRSVQVILTQDEAEAQKLAALWRTGADWATMQAEAAKTAAAPVELDDAARTEFPAPELGDAVFATPLDEVPPPVHSALGWHVLKVTKITEGGAKTFDEARDALRQRVIADKASDLMYDRENRIQNLLDSGTSLETLPGDLGVAAVTGTLDADGKTLEGNPAPIPGPAELRPALVQAAFAAKVGDPPKLIQAPNAADGSQSFFAVTVEKIIPPALKPLSEVEPQVRADWAADQRRHEQETVAAKLLDALHRGMTLAAAAEKAGLPVHRLPPVGRATPAEGVPQILVDRLFGLTPGEKPMRKGEATMVETPDGFMVAVLADIQDPDPKADPVGYGAVQQALAQAMQQDVQTAYVSAVRERATYHVNQAAVDNLAAPPSE
jgi:peptidyl-prolyl cis-trans isomerase D